jgi:anti-sigma regulatory factor (Ser/Thr protein kinase)
MASEPPTTPQSAARALSLGQWLPTVVRSVGFEVPGGPPAAAAARHRVLEELGDLLATEEQNNLALMVSELVTNCVRHAGMRDERDQIGVQAALTPERMRIEVTDSGPGFAASQPRQRSFASGIGGLGLMLLGRLSVAWGVDTGAGGCCVWAEFERPAQEMVA